MTHPIIQIEELYAAYDEKTVLRNVNLSVYERDFLGIIGPNGGGKTTLIKSILGLHQPQKGKYVFIKKERKYLKSTWDTFHSTTT